MGKGKGKPYKWVCQLNVVTNYRYFWTNNIYFILRDILQKLRYVYQQK